MTFLDMAHEGLASGWHVFPCWPMSKAPTLPHGNLEASGAPALIEAWAKKWPDANCGIATGPSGLTVVDADHGLTTWEEFLAWRDKVGLPETYTVRTGRRPEFAVQMYYRGGVMRSCKFSLEG